MTLDSPNSLSGLLVGGAPSYTHGPQCYLDGPAAHRMLSIFHRVASAMEGLQPYFEFILIKVGHTELRNSGVRGQMTEQLPHGTEFSLSHEPPSPKPEPCLVERPSCSVFSPI